MTAPAALHPARHTAHVLDGAALRTARRNARLTQSQAGDAIGRHWVTIARYEAGAIDVPGSVLGTLAGLYGVDVGEFYRPAA